jgi:hypothetical protein
MTLVPDYASLIRQNSPEIRNRRSVIPGVLIRVELAAAVHCQRQHRGYPGGRQPHYIYSVRNIGLLQYGYLDRGEKAVQAQQLQQTGSRAHLGMFV